jgi:hypothetical protein
MPTTLAPVDLANVALQKIGAQTINSLLDQTSASALACNANFQLAYLEVTRSGRWNCLLTPAVLTQIVQTPLPGAPGSTSITATAWAPLTAYLANVYVTFGGYYYQVMFNYTSTVSFMNDLTTGALTQTDTQTGSTSAFGLNGSNYPSGWSYQYALPDDFQLLGILNSQTVWDYDGAGGDNYEIMGLSLFCDENQAVIQYVKNTVDTTLFDSLFADALTYKLAAAIATPLRQDGGKLQEAMLAMYERALRKARTKNGGEQQARRFNPIRDSRFNQARYGGVNGMVLVPKFVARVLGW